MLSSVYVLDKRTAEGRRSIRRNIFTAGAVQTVYLHGMESKKFSRRASYPEKKQSHEDYKRETEIMES